MPTRGTAFAVTLTIALFAGAARAQDWKQYDYPDAGFAAQFPAPPTVSDMQYRAGAVAGPAKRYATRLGAADYSVIVADLSASPADETMVLDAAVKDLAGSGQIKLDVRARIDRQFGREVSVTGQDGGQITTAVFYVGKTLYVLAGRTAPDGSGLAAHFQQSLEFIGADGKRPRRPEDGPGFGRRRPPPQAFAACKDKAEGDAVQFQTPRGDVTPATCASTPGGLAARPNRPFRGPSNGGPPDGPPPEG